MQTTPGTSLTDTPSPPRGRLRPEILLWLTVALTAFVMDQATKWWAEDALADGQPRQVIGDLLQFRLAYNPGAAFSTGTGYTVVLTMVALAVIVVVVRIASKLHSRAWAIALGLILGGALGNVTDRIFRDPAPFRGEVVDFIEVPHWPIFNIADSAITVAAVLFVVLSLRGIGIDGRRVDDEGAAGVGDDGEDAAESTRDT